MARARKREPSPPELLDALARKLESEDLPRGLVLRGEERYFHERAIALLRKAGERAGFELSLHDAQRGNPDYRTSTVVDDLSGGGLFAAQRLVIVRNAEEAVKKVGGDKSPVAEAVERFVASDEACGCVVLTGSSLRADATPVKAIAKAEGPVLAFRRLWDSPPPWSPDPREAELVQWVVRRAREKEVRLDPRQAVYVAAATGNDLFALDDQLSRLAAGGGGNVRSIVDWQAAIAPWDVANELLAGDVARSLSGIETLFRGGFLERGGRRTVDPVALSSMLLGSLSRGTRQCLAVATELAGEHDEREALRRAGVAGSPTAMKAMLGRSRLRRPAEWRRMFADCLDLESRMKSGGVVDADAFSALALRWGSRARADRSPARARS